MNQPLLRIDEAAARGAPADFLAVRSNDRKTNSSEPAWLAVGMRPLKRGTWRTASLAIGRTIVSVAPRCIRWRGRGRLARAAGRAGRRHHYVPKHRLFRPTSIAAAT